MERERAAGHAPRTTHVSGSLGQIGGCIGCTDCRGLCRELIDMLALPDAVLRQENGT